MRSALILFSLLNASLVSATGRSSSLRRTESSDNSSGEPDWNALFLKVNRQCGRVDRCEDIADFRDTRSRSCTFYDDNKDRCSDIENRNGDSPNDACCSCGGGQTNKGQCTDKKRFTDSRGNSCSYYERDSSRCTTRFQDNDGDSSEDACCVCGGGNYATGQCKDFSGFKDSTGESCAYYERRPNQCTSRYQNSYGESSNDACCVCGGGRRQSDSPRCQDDRSFKDSAGDGCEYYEEHVGDCSDDYSNSKGVSPCEACCICGGGDRPEDDPDNGGNGQYVGKYYIQSSATGRYMHLSAQRGASLSFDKKIVEVVAYSGNYAIKQFNPYEDTNDVYLTIDNPTGSAYVDIIDNLSSDEEFEIEIVNDVFGSGAISIQHASSGRYLKALSNGDFSVSRTVSKTEHFLLKDYIVFDDMDKLKSSE